MALLLPIQEQENPTQSKTLPLTVKALKLPAFLKGKKLMSATQYWGYNGEETLRVFRYSFKADYRTLREDLKKTDCKNWTYELAEDGWSGVYEREISGEVVRQAIVLQPFRLVEDKKEKHGIRPLSLDESKGWVWVSYNEEYPKGPKD